MPGEFKTPRKAFTLNILDMYATTSHMDDYQIGYKSQILPPGDNFLQFFMDFQLLQYSVVKVSIILVREVFMYKTLFPKI